MKYLLIITAHLLGDFIFQSSTMANKKKRDLKYLTLHCIIYSGFIILSLVWFGPSENVIYAALIIIISHIIIDYTRKIILIKVSKNKKDHKTFDFVTFITVQLLHILIILCSGHMLIGNSVFGKTVLNILLSNMSWKQLHNGTIIAFLYILCLSPAAVFIKKMFVLFSFQGENDNTKGDLIKSGYLIGVLERIIILTLGINGQLGSIGFIIAAKSLARFNQLNDKEFAEKYLIGTLLSVAIVLFCVTIGGTLLIK
ncbi:MAG TPA: DUF3307 domain-containing protein [Clostridiaceae bacterium]